MRTQAAVARGVVLLLTGALLVVAAPAAVVGQDPGSQDGGDPLDLEWTMTQLEPGWSPDGVFFGGVEALPSGEFLVVGGTWTPGQLALAWGSADGLAWEPVRVPGAEGKVMTDVVAVGDGFAVTGNQLFEDRWSAFVWNSPAGPDKLKKPQRIQDAVPKQLLVTPDGPVLVADKVEGGERIAAEYSFRPAQKAKKGKKARKAAWVGRTIDAQPIERSHRMAESPDGVRLMVSWALGDDRSLTYGLWRSDDGKTWLRAEPPSADPGVASEGLGVVWVPSGFVLATNDPVSAGASGRLWHSIDGLEWTPVATSNMIHGLEATAAGVLAFTGPTFDPTMEVPTSTVLWSADGRDWSEAFVEAFRSGRINAAAMAPDGRVVAIGTVAGADPSEAQPRIWLGQPSAPVAGDGSSDDIAAQPVAQPEIEWTLGYDGTANRFVASSTGGSMCDRYGEGARPTDDGLGCWYAPGELGFLRDLGFEGEVAGFSVTDHADDVLVFMEAREAPEQRFDATGLEWARIDADDQLLQNAVGAPGAVVGEAFDMTPGPRVAFFARLSEPPTADGDSISFNINTYLDSDVTNDMLRSVEPSGPTGGGDANVAVGWTYPEGESERQPSVAVWSNAERSLLPGNVVGGPSEDPPGVWAIVGPEHVGERFNSAMLTTPMGSPTLVDRIEGASGPFSSFELDGTTQAYFGGFTMDGTANIPGKDFQLVFETPYARLFEGGTARIGFLADTTEDFFEQGFETTDSTISMGVSLLTGASGISSIELRPAEGALVAVDSQGEPVAAAALAESGQLAEINAALAEILALSMSSRIELADGQEVHLGASGT